MSKCRCCENKIQSVPILHYVDMPKAAQNFPDESSVKEEKGTDLKLYECSYCGLIQILDEPVDYYKDVIRASAVSDEMREFRLKYFKDFVDKYELKGKKVLEIGAGCGEFLKLMNTTGVEGYGIENLGESVEKCEKQGLRVFKDYIEDENQQVKKSPYDAFFIMNFLEHIPSPNTFLKGISKNLSEDAVGLVEVPNLDMILANNMFSEFISDHLMYFTKKTLSVLLEKNGFEVLECNSVWHDYCLAAIVRKRKKTDMSSFYNALDKVSDEINEFINKYKRVAIWGAGHQALAVIALSKIKNKVEFVVDSADFKQGKYTPGTHLKIVSPKILEEDKIDAIIVMAASYSDEVSSIIRDKFPEIKIAILREYGLEYIMD